MDYQNCVLVISVCFVVTVYAQNMDPKVNIVETVPSSDGYLVRGTIARDVTLDCLVEDLLTDKQVWWVRTITDKSGRNTTTAISKDTDINDNNKWSIEKPSPYRWRLRIKALRVEDEGTYWCYVELNRETRVQDWKTVLATDPPQIIQAITTSDLTAKEGDFVTLLCNASGRPVPTIMWRREGNAILPGGGVVRLNSKLDIQSIQYTDRGRYICEGYNLVGHTMRTITVDVQFGPKVIPDPPVVEQALGYMRTLVCIVEANPTPNTDIEEDNPQLLFLRDGISISPDARRKVNILEGAYGKITMELTINDIVEGDYGVYECKARNFFGDGSNFVELAKSDVVVPDKGGKSSSAVKETCSVLMPFFIFVVVSANVLLS